MNQNGKTGLDFLPRVIDGKAFVFMVDYGPSGTFTEPKTLKQFNYGEFKEFTEQVNEFWH